MDPWFWIIGGANGTGKSSLAEELMREGTLPVPPDAPWLNPDLFAVEIRHSDASLTKDEVDGRAIVRADALVDQYIAERRSCVVETVLTHQKHKDRLERAHRVGLKVGLFYVVLPTVEVSIARVASRVLAGGHDVPEEKIRKRWDLSLDALGWFATRVDKLMVYLNEDVPVRVAGAVDGEIIVMSGCPDHAASRLRAAQQQRTASRLG